MSGQYLNAITENATRLGQRLQESFSERTRDLNLARGSGYLDALDDGGQTIKLQLDSNSDREKLEALKRLVALISKGRNVSEHFAQVVKNVASPNLEIRKLVYIYLLRYAEQEPDLALLSINTFQKDLADSNPLIRAMALRVLSGIKVPMIGSIVVLAIKKCAADLSPYVRKTACLAIPKCYELDPHHAPALISIINTLLRDRSPLSVGSVVVAFEAVCPTRLDLLHKQYRRLCRILVEAEEWGQVNLLNLLTRYARTMLPRPFIKDDEEELDSDVELLLTSVEPLFQSRNPAVVLAAARVLLYIGPPSRLPKTVSPLLRLLSVSREVERVVLVYIFIISQTIPNFFAPFYSRFFLRTDDIKQLKLEKIRVLIQLINLDTHQAILRELIDCADDRDDQVVAAAIHGLGRCAALVPDCTQQCLTALIIMIRSAHDIVVSSAVLVLKNLVQSQLASSGHSSLVNASQNPVAIISRLAQRIDDIRHAQARACVFWLVGQYASSNRTGLGPEGMAEWAPDVLRKAAKGFGQEEPVVKLQIVTLAAKLFVLAVSDRTLGLLSQYVFSLARYDLNYDVRDRARMLTSMLSGLTPMLNGISQEERGGVTLRREQVRLVLFDGKESIADGTRPFDPSSSMVGSLAAITDKPIRLDSILPDWLEQGVEPSLRESEEDVASSFPAPLALSSAQVRTMGTPLPVVLTPTGASPGRPGTPSSGSKGVWTDLDSFYADAQEEGGTESEESEESEEGSESEASKHDHGAQAHTEGDSEEAHSPSQSDDEDEDESDENASGGVAEADPNN